MNWRRGRTLFNPVGRCNRLFSSRPAPYPISSRDHTTPGPDTTASFFRQEEGGVARWSGFSKVSQPKAGGWAK